MLVIVLGQIRDCAWGRVFNCGRAQESQLCQLRERNSLVCGVRSGLVMPDFDFNA